MGIYSLTKKKVDNKYLLVLFIIALLIRLPFLFADYIPDLSDDIFRYRWDGKVQYEGYNPYSFSPKEIINKYPHLKDIHFNSINHPEIPTIYPPFLQAVFYLIYSIHSSILAFKIVFMIFDILTSILIISWLSRLKLNKALFIIYSWNPLVILEFYHSGHSDSLMVLLITLTLYLYTSYSKKLSIISLAFLTITKFIGLVLLPFYYKKVPFRYMGLFFVIIIGFYGFYYDPNLFTGLLHFSKYWEYNSFFYKALKGVFGNREIPKLILGIVFLILYLKKWKDVFMDDRLFIKSSFFVLGCVLLFSPVLHPWYVILIIPFLVISPSRGWILFSGLVVLSYIIRMDYYRLGIWEESIYVIMAEYIPFYGLLIYDFIRQKKLRIRVN